MFRISEPAPVGGTERCRITSERGEKRFLTSGKSGRRKIEQVRKRGLPPFCEFNERGQAPLPDLF